MAAVGGGHPVVYNHLRLLRYFDADSTREKFSQ